MTTSEIDSLKSLALKNAQLAITKAYHIFKKENKTNTLQLFSQLSGFSNLHRINSIYSNDRTVLKRTERFKNINPKDTWFVFDRVTGRCFRITPLMASEGLRDLGEHD